MEEFKNQTLQNQESIGDEESTVAAPETVEPTPKKSKKKLAIILASVGAAIVAIAVALAILLGGNGGGSQTESKTPSEEAQDNVKYQMMVEMNWMTLGGSDITFVSCTYGTTRDLGNNCFKVSGTVKVRDQYGNFHVANYDADVEYDEEYDDWDADIEYGSFRKQ